MLASTTATIASTRSWSMTIEKDVLETTALGATYKSNIGGLIAGSGSSRADLLRQQR
jgi:hypothetical protein